MYYKIRMFKIAPFLQRHTVEDISWKKEHGKVPFVCVYFVTESGELVEEKGYAKLAEFRGKHNGFAF